MSETNPLTTFTEQAKEIVISASRDDNAKFYPESRVDALTAAAKALIETELSKYALEVREGVATESCEKHSPDDSNPMLHHQQVYDELNWALEKRGLPNTEPDSLRQSIREQIQ